MSVDFKVRQWIYKLIALLRADMFIPHLSAQISDGEDHDDNITWAFAALALLAPYENVQNTIRKNYGSRLAPYHVLPARLYSNANFTLCSNPSMLLNSLEKETLTAKWIALLYGFDRLDDSLIGTLPPHSIIPSLSRHHDSEVVEYSIWAIYRSSDTAHALKPIAPQDFSYQPPNVRRWLFRLLLSERGSWKSELDFLKNAIGLERDSSAADGLALGLRSCYDNSLSEGIVRWFLEENRPVIHNALLTHIATYSDRDASYFQFMSDLVESTSIENTDDQRLVNTIASTMPKGHPTRNAVSKVKREVARNIHFVDSSIVLIGEATLNRKIESGQIGVYNESGKVDAGNISQTASITADLNSVDFPRRSVIVTRGMRSRD